MVESCKRNTLNFVLSASIIQSKWLYRDLHKIITVAPISKVIRVALVVAFVFFHFNQLLSGLRHFN
jgi:hypothetical protein